MMSLIWAIIIGFIVGAIAKFIMPGKENLGWVMTTVLGIVGSFVGSFIGRGLGMYQDGQAAGFFMSVIGAIVVLAIYGAIVKKK